MKARLSEISLLFGIFIIPLLTSNPLLGYEQTKVLGLIFFVSLTSVIWLASSKAKKVSLHKSPIFISATIFMLTLAISTILSINQQASFLGRAPYYQGLILYLYLYLFYLLVVFLKIPLEKYAICLSASSILVSLEALREWLLSRVLFDQHLWTYSGRVISTFGQPNFYSGFIILTLPFSAWLAKSDKKIIKILGFLNLLLGSLAVIVSQSKLAITLLVVIFIVFLASVIRGKLKNIVLTVSLTVMIFSLILSLLLTSGVVWEQLDKPPRADYFWHDFPTRGFYFWQFSWSQNPEKRLYIWPVVGELILKKPLTGFGLENLIQIFPTANLAKFHGIQNLTIDRAHNLVLDLLVQSGLLGFVAWLILIYELLKKSQPNKMLLAALAIYLIWVQFQNQSVVHLLYFWLMAGLIDTSAT